MATGVYSWSQTAATNATADSTINWAEGMSPAAVDDSARAMMAGIAKWRDDISGVQPSNVIQTTAGSANAQTLTSNGSIAALTNGWTLTFQVGSGLTNTGACTLAVDSLVAKNIQSVAGTNLTGAELYAGSVYTVTYHQPTDSWVLHGGPVPSSQFLTAGTASGSTCPIVFPSSYTAFRGIEIVLNGWRPANNNVSLILQFSTNGGSSYDNSAGNYEYAVLWAFNGNGSTAATSFGFSSTGDTSIDICDGTNNDTTATANGKVTIWNPSSSSVRTRCSFDMSSTDDAGIGMTNRFSGAGARTATQSTNAVQFLFSSGNISAGTYAVYGMR